MIPHGHSGSAQSRIRLGFVPLCDCAPVAVAKELGIFEKHGLNVVLSRELGWASVRDKIFYGDLDAAESISGLAFALGMGLTELRCDVAVPLILNLHGNAITLSTDIEPSIIGNGSGLQSHLERTWKKDRPFTLAVTHRYSSHHILLHQWLRRHGLGVHDDVEVIFLPPPLMPRQLKAGHIDGYCVGEPWNSEAILAGYGWCPVVSSDLSHSHPEKILLLSGKFLKERKDESVALTAALLDACRTCQAPAFREEMISILAMSEYTGASREVLSNSLASGFNSGTRTSFSPDFHIFHGDGVNRPTVEKASWVLAGLRSIGILPEVTAGSLSRIYREDLFHAAQHLAGGAMTTTHPHDEAASAP